MSFTSFLDVTLMAARLSFSWLWSLLMLAVIVASLTLSASYWLEVISLVFSSRERRLVSAAIMAWVLAMLEAWAAVGVTIKAATLNANTRRGADRVVPRRRTRIIVQA